MQSFAELVITGGAQTLALSATATQFNLFSQTGGAVGAKSSDLSIQADLVNNRLLMLPGTYLIQVNIDCIPNAESDITLRVRKNGTAVANMNITVPGRQDVLTFNPNLSPGWIPQANAAEQILSVPGILTTDKLLNVIKPAAQGGLGIAGVRISSAGNIGVNFINIPASGSSSPTQGQVWQVIVARFGKALLSFIGALVVNAGSPDVPGTVADFPATNPANFTGASGAPLGMCPVDLTLEAPTNTPTITATAARFFATRLSG